MEMKGLNTKPLHLNQEFALDFWEANGKFWDGRTGKHSLGGLWDSVVGLSRPESGNPD